MENQYPQTVKTLAHEIERVREALRNGGRASVEANRLHAAGVSPLHIVLVFREATGAGLGDLKGFGRWWGENGVTDAESFDAYAATLDLNEKVERLSS